MANARSGERLRIASVARKRAAAVRDDPEERYGLAADFYADISGTVPHDYGRAELAFMRWEIDRGVLNSPHDRKRGSAWWRTVNERIIVDALESRLLADAGLAKGSSPSATLWRGFLDAPTPIAWYRAHNASVLAGYIEAARVAARERPAEQFLMNLILARVLFAQALAEGEPFAVGNDPLIARFLSDPRSPAVPVVMDIPDFYPRTYPLDPVEEELLERRARSSEDDALALIDREPCENLDSLFAFAARSLDRPELARFVVGRLPCYPHGLLREPDPGGRELWLPWLAPEIAAGSRWHDDHLEDMRFVADPEADEIVADYFEEFASRGAGHFFRQLVLHPTLPPQECSQAVMDYLAEQPPLPRWADREMMRAGEEFFGRWGLFVPLVLICSSLPECYGAAKGVQVLHLTARLASDTRRRIVETAQMVLDVMAPGGMEPGAVGYQTVRRVRLMHAGVRHLIRTDPRISRTRDGPGPRWLEEWGVPINQEDLAGTLLTFSWTVVGGLSALGVPVSESEAEAYLHAWKVVGAMLGVREELLPDDCADADALSERIRRRQRKPSPEGREMTEALLEMLRESIPGRVVPGFGPSMIRHFIGDAADELGVPKGGRAGSLFQRASLLATASGLTQQHSWALRKAAGLVSRSLLSRYASFDRGGDRPRFEIPSSLAATWPSQRHGGLIRR